MPIKEQDFTKGKILPAIIKFSIPCIVMNLIQSLFVLTDLFIVGHWSEYGESIAAITISASPLWLHMIFLMGLGGAVNVLVGRTFGAKELDKMDNIVGSSMTLFLTIGLVFSIELFFCAELFLKLLKTPTEVMPLAISYLKISTLGFLPIAGFNLLGSVLRGVGNSVTPLLYISVGLITNIILDIVCVIYLDMGSSGAAVATVISQFFGISFALFYLRKKQFLFRFEIKDFRFCKDILKNLFSLALPISMQEIFVEISFMVILTIVNMMGATESAGYGIVLKIWSFTALPAYSFAIVLMSIASQNIGAIRLKRTKEALYWCLLLSSAPCWLYVMFIQLFPEFVISIFTNKPDIIKAGSDFLLSSSWEIAFISFEFCLTSFYTACGKPIFAMINTIASHFIIKLPLAYLFVFVLNGGMYMLGWSFTIPTMVIAIIYFYYFATGKWTKIKKL